MKMFLSCKTWFRIFLPLLIYKVAFLVLVLVAREFMPHFFDEGTFFRNFHWPEDLEPDKWTVFRTWDANHYLFLIDRGYTPGAMSNAFYPLWPLLVRILTPLFGANPILCGIVVANVLSLAAWVIFHAWVERRFGTEAALYSLLALVAYPGSIFFQFMYSESLFLFLLVLLVVSVESLSLWGLLFAGLLLPLTRPLGILIFPYLVYSLMFLKTPRKFFVMLTPLMGFGIYLCFMYWQTGDFFAGFAAQRSFISQRSILSLFHLWDFCLSFINVGGWHGLFDSGLDRLFFVAFVIACFGLINVDHRLLLLIIPLGFVSAVTGSFMSYSRYLAVLFPVFVFYGSVLAGVSRCSQVAAILALMISFALQILFLVLFINNRWVA